jgi:hypothetical protein
LRLNIVASCQKKSCPFVDFSAACTQVLAVWDEDWPAPRDKASGETPKKLGNPRFSPLVGVLANNLLLKGD